MSVLKERLRQKIDEWRPRTARLMNDYGDVVIDEVTIAKALGGMPMLARIIRCYHRFWKDAEPYWTAIIEEPET